MRKYSFLICNLIYVLLVPNILNAQTPSIISFSPSSGTIGSLVTVIGANLGKPAAFTIGGVTAIVVSDTSIIPGNYGDTLVGLVMPGATTGIVSVTTTSGTAISSSNFKLLPTSYPSSQQGNKLVGTGVMGSYGYQGNSVSISADGNTAIVGGPYDNSNAGAAWVYIRSAGTWTQQGSKLVGTGAIGTAYQGVSVSISADGNTAIVGGADDSSGIGAAWIYIRSDGQWAQEGSKLIGTGAVGAANQGESVSISADGNTALVGGPSDGVTGAVWVFTRSAGKWAQEGSKLVGTGTNGIGIYQGCSISISADGNTAIVGGYGDNSEAGAAWVYTRSSGIWTQQGSKLIGTGAIGSALQGWSVSISADGNTAIVGGQYDNSNIGAAWVYSRSAGIWVQQGNKLVGTGAAGAAYQGNSVSISADGNTAIVGGPYDNGQQGALWVYSRSGGTWTQQGSKLVGTGDVGPAMQGTSASLSADGNTVLVGGILDSNSIGAAWVFASNVTGIENISNQSLVTLYPNPSIGVFTIEMKSGNVIMNSQVEIYNVLGEKIFTSQYSTPTSQFQINLNNNPSGIYLYRLLTENGDLIMEGKMIIQK